MITEPKSPHITDKNLMIEINERFTVAAPPARSTRSCPTRTRSSNASPVRRARGAHEDGSYDGSMTVKFSALRVSFAGHVALDLDEPGPAGTVNASGRDGQGGTKFEATATFTVAPGDDDRRRRVGDSQRDVDLCGKLASVIEGAAGAVGRADDGRVRRSALGAVRQRCHRPRRGSHAGRRRATRRPARPRSLRRMLLLHGFGGSPNGCATGASDWPPTASSSAFPACPATAPAGRTSTRRRGTTGTQRRRGTRGARAEQDRSS